MPNKKAAEKIRKLNIPETVQIQGKTYKVTGIVASAFKGCKKLTSVTIGKNITFIGAKAFEKCKKLKKITIKAAGLMKIDKNAFKGIDKKR